MRQRQIGHDIGSVGVASIDACKEACASDVQCKAATYEAKWSTCYLHNASGSTAGHGDYDHIVKICTGKCSNFFGRVE